MKITEYVDIEKVYDLCTSGYLRIQTHPTESLAILNYANKTQFENAWDETTTRSRGLIYDLTTDEIVARPFEKFFNWGQVDRDMLPSGQIRVQDKMDGSLGILYQEPSTGRLAIATRGSFTSDQAVHATEVLQTRYEDFRPLEGMTYLFEIIYPENRIVVDYGSLDDLVLLDIIENRTGKSYVDLFWARSTWPGPITERFEYPSIADVLSTEPREGKEGFVVTYDNGFRIKVKQEEYVRLHRLLTGVSNKSIWEILANQGNLSEILDRVPDEYYHWVKNTVDGLTKDFNRIAGVTWQNFASVMQRRPSDHHALDSDPRALRKWFAEQVTNSDYKGILFGLYDEKNVDEAIWKLVKPEYSKPYWNQSEDVA